MKTAVVGAASLYLAWLSIGTATVEELTRQNPDAAAKISPGDPRIAVRRAMLEFARNNGTITPEARDAVVASAARFPLADEPYFIAGMGAALRKDSESARALLEEARRRNPRSRVTRLILLDRYFQEDRVADAAMEITVLTRLLPEAAKVLVPELSKFAANPASERALRNVLRSDPAMRELVLEHLASNNADPNLIFRIAADGGGSRSWTEARWPSMLLTSLVEKKRIDQAYSYWARLANPDPSATQSRVYDGAFRGLPGPSPFNWSLSATGAGVAERVDTPALQVDYYGREATELASQLLRLSSGQYRLSFGAEGQADGEASRLAWRIECLGSKAVLADIPLSKVTHQRKAIAGSFRVPSSECAAQWLRLVGVPAEFPKAQSAALSNLQIQAGR